MTREGWLRPSRVKILDSRLKGSFLLLVLTGVISYELGTGKLFTRSGGVVRKNEHPWIYWSFLGMEIAFLVFLGTIGLYLFLSGR